MSLLLAACGGDKNPDQSLGPDEEQLQVSGTPHDDKDQPEEEPEQEETFGREYPVSAKMSAWLDEMELSPVYTVDSTWDDFEVNRLREAEKTVNADPTAATRRTHTDVTNVPGELCERFSSFLLMISAEAKDGSNAPVYVLDELATTKNHSFLFHYPADMELSDFEITLRIEGLDDGMFGEAEKTVLLSNMLDESRIVTQGDVYEGQLFRVGDRVLLCRGKTSYDAGTGSSPEGKSLMTGNRVMMQYLGDLSKDHWEMAVRISLTPWKRRDSHADCLKMAGKSLPGTERWRY